MILGLESLNGLRGGDILKGLSQHICPGPVVETNIVEYQSQISLQEHQDTFEITRGIIHSIPLPSK